MNFNGIKWGSLKTRIILVTLLVFVLSIWSLSFYASRSLQKDLQQQLGEQQLSIATVLAADINQELEFRLRSLENISNKITPIMFNNTGKLQKFLDDRYILQILFNGGYFVIQTDGNTIADFPISTGRVGMNVSEKGWMVEALKGKSTVGKPVLGKKLQVPVFTLATPIHNSEGKVIGVLAGVIDLSKPTFMDKVVENKYGKTGEFLLVSPQHRLIVTASDKNRIMQALPAAGINTCADRNIAGFEGFTVSVNPIGVKQLASIKKVPVAHWYLAVTLPTKEAFAPIESMQKRMMFATLFLTLLSGCLTWWVLNRKLAPIFTAIDTVTAMSKTNQPAKLLPIVHQDEIGQLIDSFNSLLKTLGHREEALKFSEVRFRKAIEEAPFPIMIHAEHGEVLALNRAWTELSGYTLADIPTTAVWAEKAHGLNRQTVLAEIEALFNLEHRKAGGEYAVTCQDGSEKIWAFSSVPINFISDGRRTVMSMAADVTARKRAEEEKLALEQQFQQTQKLESLGVLAGGIAHDFNNILAIIMGYCSLIQMDYGDAEKHIPEIEKATERAAALCRQMLAYAGKAQFVEDQVDTWMLVDEMVAMLKTTIKQNIVIKPELCTDTHFITGDASQIRQIVMNLIINAAEAIGEEQGEIHVSLAKVNIKAGQAEKDHLGKIIPAGQYICLEVTDNGCGMDDETRPKIFEPFYTTKFTGRGLGMSAVLGIIDAHKGAIQLTSQLGKGTIFKVYLPVQSSDTTGDETQSPATPSAPWYGRGTILLAEDEEQVKLIAKKMLANLGFTVIEASNGKEALESYHNNTADITLVITDIGMPVMNGYELFRELKKLDPKLPIIISSGFGESDITCRIPVDEIAGLINKPYSFDQLGEALRNMSVLNVTHK